MIKVNQKKKEKKKANKQTNKQTKKKKEKKQGTKTTKNNHLNARYFFFFVMLMLSFFLQRDAIYTLSSYFADVIVPQEYGCTAVGFFLNIKRKNM